MLLWQVHGVTSESVDGSAMLNGVNTLNITRLPSKTVSGRLARIERKACIRFGKTIQKAGLSHCPKACF